MWPAPCTRCSDGCSGPDLPVRVRAWDGSVIGPPSSPTTIVIESPNALRRMLYAPGELGLSRAFVAGDLSLEGDVFDLLALRDRFGAAGDHVEVGIGPKDLPELIRTARRLGAIGPPLPAPPEEARLKGRRHSPARDRAAIAHHYDVGNDFYRLILGPSLTYSCAHWSRPGATLEEAQAAKYELVCTKLGLRPGMRLLDIGCGWGGMALHAAEHHGVTVVGITLSKEQRRLAVDRAAAAGLSDRIELREQDYRAVDDGPFDAVSSIGMFEHVGEARTAEYMARIHSLVRPGGRAAQPRHLPPARPVGDPRPLLHRPVRVPRRRAHGGGQDGVGDARGRVRGARRRVPPRALRADPAGVDRQPGGGLGRSRPPRRDPAGPGCGSSTWRRPR